MEVVETFEEAVEGIFDEEEIEGGEGIRGRLEEESLWRFWEERREDWLFWEA